MRGLRRTVSIKWKTVEKAAPAKTPGAASWRIRTQGADAPRHRVLLLGGLGGSLARDAAEDDDVRVGVAAETVRAVRDAGHFTRSPETRDDLAFGRQGLGLFVDANAAHRVVGGRNGLDVSPSSMPVRSTMSFPINANSR